MKKDLIINVISDYFGYSFQEIKRGRSSEFVLIRTIIGYHLNKYCHMSIRECSKKVKVKHHGTLSWHINRLDKKLVKDEYLQDDFENIKKLVDYRIKNFNPIEHGSN